MIMGAGRGVKRRKGRAWRIRSRQRWGEQDGQSVEGGAWKMGGGIRTEEKYRGAY